MTVVQDPWMKYLLGLAKNRAPSEANHPTYEKSQTRLGPPRGERHGGSSSSPTERAIVGLATQAGGGQGRVYGQRREPAVRRDEP